MAANLGRPWPLWSQRPSVLLRAGPPLQRLHLDIWDLPEGLTRGPQPRPPESESSGGEGVGNVDGKTPQVTWSVLVLYPAHTFVNSIQMTQAEVMVSCCVPG